MTLSFQRKLCFSSYISIYISIKIDRYKLYEHRVKSEKEG